MKKLITLLASAKSIAKVQQYNLTVAQSGQTWAAALQGNPAMKADIMTIAADSTKIGYAAAGAILTNAYGTTGYENIEMPGGSSSRLAKTTANNVEKTGSTASTSKTAMPAFVTLVAYPNPTNGILNVAYIITDPTCNEATLQLVEMGTGRILLSKTVACTGTQTQVDMNEYANGVYSLSIQSNQNAPKIIRVIKLQ